MGISQRKNVLPFGVKSLLSKYMIKTHYIMKVVAFPSGNPNKVDLIQDVYEFGNTYVGQFVQKWAKRWLG